MPGYITLELWSVLSLCQLITFAANCSSVGLFYKSDCENASERVEKITGSSLLEVGRVIVGIDMNRALWLDISFLC